MAEVTNRTLNVFINTGDAQKSFDKLIQKEKDLKVQLEKATDPKLTKSLQDQLNKLQEPISRAAKKLSGELAPSMKDLQKTAQNLGNQLKHMSESDADFSKVLQQFKQAQLELSEIKNKVHGVQTAFDETKTSTTSGKILEYAKGTLLGGAITGVVSNFSSFLSDSIDEALSAEEGTARFKSTLDNLGRSDAFDRIIAKADEMAEKFKYLDNDDVVGVFNKLVDYGKLTEQQMNDLLPVIINFAAKNRISLDESTDVIVKALNGQGKALKQYGIELNATGTTAENLGVVMGTLAAKVDGAADAFQNSAAGGIAASKQEMANLKEEIGTGLIPVMNVLLNMLSTFMGSLRMLGTGVSNAFSDFKILFTEGIDAANAAVAKRNEDAIINPAAENLARQFAGKAAAEIYGEIDKVAALIDAKQKAIAAKQRGVKEGFANKDDVKLIEQYTQDLKVLTKEQELLNKLLEKGSGQVLGMGGDDKNKPKKDPAAEKALADYRALMKELERIKREQALFDKTDKEKEIAAVVQHYAELKEKAKGHKDALLQIESLFQTEMLQLQVKWGRIEMQQLDKEQKEREAAREKALQESMQRTLARLAALNASIEAFRKKQQVDKIAGLQIQVADTSQFSPKRLELQKKLLDQQMYQELQATDLTENQKALIEQQYREKKADAEKEFYNNLVGTILNFANQALQVLAAFGNAKTASENAELERDKKANEKKKNNLKSQLDGKRLTQQEYDRQVAEMDKKQEAKEKQVHLQQFRRQQRMAIAQALISGAMGIQKTVAEWGMPLAIPWIALTAAATVAQVATITKQQPPEMARGGQLKGPSHQSKTRGMPVTDPTTGQVQALLEGDELITNKRTAADPNKYTVSGTPSQIISRLNSLHGGVAWDQGATLIPAWRNLAPARMNFAALNASMRTVRMFKDGGVFGSAPGGSTTTDASDASLAIMQNIATVLENLQGTLAAGIKAPIMLGSIENAQARQQAIINEATLKP